MVIGLVFIWLLLGLLAAVIIREHDGSIPLLCALLFIVCGVVSLLVVAGVWLWGIDI